MKHLKPFNESKDNLVEDLQDFCETSLAYLLDDGYDISVTLRDKVKFPDKQHLLVTLGLNGIGEDLWLQDYNLFSWNDVKDYYIPFIQMLVRRYELLDYPAGDFAFNTERGIFYVPLEYIINDQVSQVFDCRIWGINLKILDNKT
jgi:hypothetical protein